MSTASLTGPTGTDNLLGFAALGKTALALALVMGLIVLCSWLLRRIGPARPWPGQHLRVIGSTLLGQRERLVIVEVQDTWLVLGVTAGQISKLHELPAPPAAPTDTPSVAGDTFAERFAGVIRQRLGGRNAEQPERP
ncbi:FliO/MopB family protein [Azotobacter armeniacus]